MYTFSDQQITEEVHDQPPAPLQIPSLLPYPQKSFRSSRWKHESFLLFPSFFYPQNPICQHILHINLLSYSSILPLGSGWSSHVNRFYTRTFVLADFPGSSVLKRSLVFPILLFSSISLHWSLRKVFLSLLDILWNSAFKWVYLSFPPVSFASLLFTAICKASSDNHFAFFRFFLHFFLSPS